MSSSTLRSRWASLCTRGLSTRSQFKCALERGAPIDVHPEVEDAMMTNKPIVALETTLITHGFPRPQNLQLGRSLENIVRSTGSIPATIGVIGGRVKIGLEESELERLAERTRKPVKLSRRDVATAIATKADGGTTCSATLLFAALAGIRVFATGGLGGVHRGGENSMDVSADLVELARSPVGLVSAGVKSILDIGRTLEYLETLGVPVISYSETREFPAFFTRQSGYEVPWNVSDPMTAATILYTQWQLGMDNGALIAVPIPDEYEMIGAKIQDAVYQAVADSEQNGINKRGKEATPWLLQRVSELTNKESLISNIALLENTAKIGGEIAVHYHRLVDEPKVSYMPVLPVWNQTSAHDKEKDSSLVSSWSLAKLAIVGSAAVDITAKAIPDDNLDLGRNSTMPGTVSLTLGGVARNIAETAHRVLTSIPRTLPGPPLLISSVGNDAFGKLLTHKTRNIGMRTDGLLRSPSNQRTAVCNMVLDNQGELIGGVADMGITEALDSKNILPIIDKIRPDIIVLDGNLTPTTLTAVVEHCALQGIKVFFEPTSVIKSVSILPAITSCLDKMQLEIAPVTFASPNILELANLDQAARSESHNLSTHLTWRSPIDTFSLRADIELLAKRSVCEEDSCRGTLDFQGVARMAINLLPFFQHLIVKCGEQGVLIAMDIDKPSAWSNERSNISKRYVVAHGRHGNTIVLHHLPARFIRDPVNVTGAGDSFVGALLAFLIQQPNTFDNHRLLVKAISASQQAAILTLQSHLAVSPAISYCNITKND
ncbi:hypothetical protein APHAL10511_006415 [Amanita phalloides]|nr:hypothetical protein APHAL10511_006415 [Amanita phalloides]